MRRHLIPKATRADSYQESVSATHAGKLGEPNAVMAGLVPAMTAREHFPTGCGHRALVSLGDSLEGRLPIQAAWRSPAMPAAVKLRGDDSADGLRSLAKRSRDGNHSRRLLSPAAIRDGMARRDLGRRDRMLGVAEMPDRRDRAE